MEKNIQFILHRGVSFCDASLINSKGEAINSCRFLYSKHKFKAQIEAFVSPHAGQINSVILLDEFADRLSGLRLGGSVAAVFPKGLEKLTDHIQESPIHSETVVFAAPDAWDDEWKTRTLETLKEHTIKRIAWQCATPPEEILNFFQENGLENFVTENLHPTPILNWRRNLLNASCSGPVLELTEEVQLALKNVQYEGPIHWMDEDLEMKEKIYNRYGLTSAWTHLVAKWAEKKTGRKTDVFILDWDGCFHIGQPETLRWTPWGPVSSPKPLPNVRLYSIQPTQTLEKNGFDEWQWTGRADNFEPGPVFMGRGLKPTVLDFLLSKELIESQFETKSDCSEKLNRQVASLMGLKQQDQIQNQKDSLKRLAIQIWAQETLQLSQTDCWIMIGPLAEFIQSQFKTLPGYKIQTLPKIPNLSELYSWSNRA